MALIFDIGMYDGVDTEYYLASGHSVVAVEALSEMTARAEEKFNKDIISGRLTILNVAIAAQTGESEFWVCEDCLGWSSLNELIAARLNARYHSRRVPAIRFDELLARFGMPHYLKVDIESADHLCVEALDRTERPDYISIESECAGSQESLREEQFLRNLRVLNEAGYNRFKLVDQSTLVPVYPCNIECALTRAYARQFETALEQRTAWRFSPGSSGPWGEDVFGPWMSFAEAADVYRRLREIYFSSGDNLPHSFWFDWHAKVVD